MDFDKILNDMNEMGMNKDEKIAALNHLREEFISEAMAQITGDSQTIFFKTLKAAHAMAALNITDESKRAFNEMAEAIMTDIAEMIFIVAEPDTNEES